MIYVAVLAYADNGVLPAPTASVIGLLLSICYDDANEHSAGFNAKNQNV